MKHAIYKGTVKHSDNLIVHETKELIRINKYISSNGHYSRREADKVIEAGLVSVNGVKASLGTKVTGEEKITINGKDVYNKNLKRVYIMLHKPTGITCTNDLNIPGNIRAYVNYPDLIYPIGRLDKDSSGLILLTNDGDIVNKILRSEGAHDKEYVVTVDKDYDDEFLKNMAAGVLILNQVTNKMQVTKKCEIKKLDQRTFKLILQQGLNRQIRRMTETLGYKVKSLKRIRVMNVRLGDLQVGEWRYLTDKELKIINELIK